MRNYLFEGSLNCSYEKVCIVIRGMFITVSSCLLRQIFQELTLAKALEKAKIENKYVFVVVVIPHGGTM